MANGIMQYIQKSKLDTFIIRQSLNLCNLLKWATIIPSNAIMPFPLGQVWFLHALIIICLVSPLLFWLYKRNLPVFIILLCCSVATSVIQMNYNIVPFFKIGVHNLFNPFIHVLFFCIGFMVIDMPRLRSPYISSAIVTLCFIAIIVFINILDINPDYAKHTSSSDLYYVVGSTGAIWLFLMLQQYIMKLYKMLPLLIQHASNFLFRHTFAIYLLHSFAIFFVEKVFGLVNPQQKTISYGIIKLVLVLFVTLLLSPMFTRISSLVSNQILILTGRTMSCLIKYRQKNR
ncbi:acyltransferase [bacterium]|nr:acyltransferase [bacterium]